MKKRIITPMLFLFFINGFSQDLNNHVSRKYLHPIKKEQLNKARLMSDVMPYFPAEYIMNYISVDIVATCNGRTRTVSGPVDTLSAEQKDILNSADLGTEIVIDINYKYTRVRYSTTLVPEIEAEYASGYQKMAQYLNENVMNKIPNANSEEFKGIIIKFTVDEAGEITNAQVDVPSMEMETEKSLIDALHKMPKWKPAENSKGEKVKQEFEFSFGNHGC